MSWELNGSVQTDFNALIQPQILYQTCCYITVYIHKFALRGHVTSFLWKWKLYDFAFEKQLVGQILSKIMVIWFVKPEPFS